MNKKSTQIIVIVLVVVAVVVLAAGFMFNNKTKDTNNVTGLVAYTADENMEGYKKCEEMTGVEFYYPENYVSVGKSTQPMYMDPDIPGASINLIADNFPTSMTFEGYIDASIIGIKKQMTIEGDISKEYINLNGVKAAKLSYVATSKGQTMSITQVAIIKDSKAYILTVGSLKDDAEKLQPKLEKIIKSFK